MPNLAQALRTTQGEVVQFPKKERNSMSKKEEGYTRLPNALIDGQIMADLNDKAFKCLLLIIRQTLGFDRASHPISVTQFQKFCGIKKRDTVMASIKELEEVGIVVVERSLGHLNTYSLSIDQYQQKVLVPLNGTGIPKGDGTSTSEQDGGSPVERGTNKENFKERFKEIKKTDVLVDKSKTEMFSESIEYHGKDKTEYGLRELAGVYTIQSDFMNHAKRINPKLDDEKIMSELKNFAQWSTSQNKTTAQGWMNFWIYRIKNLKTSKPRNSQSAKAENTKPKALSDAQISWFSSELCNYGPFSSRFANMGEKPKEFISRITANLRKPEHVKTYAPYLNELGFVVSLEEFHAE